MYGAKIVQFGNKFQGRLESGLIQNALDYVKFNEERLAFELLLDHICEHDLPLACNEYEEALHLGLELGLEIGEAPLKHLRALVVA
jgi:hypothetical protein